MQSCSLHELRETGPILQLPREKPIVKSSFLTYDGAAFFGARSFRS